MIVERALLAWAREVCTWGVSEDGALVVRVLRYLRSTGALIPEKHLIEAMQSLFAHPPGPEDCRDALITLELIPETLAVTRGFDGQGGR